MECQTIFESTRLMILGSKSIKNMRDTGFLCLTAVERDGIDDDHLLFRYPSVGLDPPQPAHVTGIRL